jgi:putative endonuclease
VSYFVDIAANEWRTLYIGMAVDLQRRMKQHKARLINGFTRRYVIDQLVYFQQHPSKAAAARRERTLKGWRRARKLALIDAFNPQWRDLADPCHLLRKQP